MIEKINTKFRALLRKALSDEGYKIVTTPWTNEDKTFLYCDITNGYACFRFEIDILNDTACRKQYSFQMDHKWRDMSYILETIYNQLETVVSLEEPEETDV